MSSEDDLLVFGYSSRIYPPDERSDYIAEEQHLIDSPNNPALRIDRYDCRLLLPAGYDLSDSSAEIESCPTEDLEEEMCDEERYRDLSSVVEPSPKALQRDHENGKPYREWNCDYRPEEEDNRNKKAEIGFDYGTASTKSNDESVIGGSDDSDSESEPFVPPSGIKLPVGLVVPENQKQNHIIERTAVFVVTKGPQMEIVIKARQRNNMEQFGFLEFDNPLHPYYKYLSKLIREKKYTPNFSKQGRNGTQPDQNGSSSPVDARTKKSNALTVLAEQHESDSDSDSDCELHPSLISGGQKRVRSPDMMDTAENSVGPRRRPASPPPPPVTVHRHDYDMSKSNDIYASLFKSLAQVSVEREQAELRKMEKLEIEKHIAAAAPPPPDEDYQAWWLSFYGTPCPYSNPQPMVPPPPDLQPVISSYAEFVARHGAEAEMELRERVDLQLTFMLPSSPHFSYYQHRVRMSQWEMAHLAAMQMESMEEQSVSTTDFEAGGEGAAESTFETVVDDASLPSTSSSMQQDPTAPSLNRKQRRRLQDGFRVATTQPVGIVDPVATISLADGSHVPRVNSSPALLSAPGVPQQLMEQCVTSDSTTAATLTTAGVVAAPGVVVIPPARSFASVPVSFSIAPVKEESSVLTSGIAIAEEPGSNVLVDARTLSPLSAAQPPLTSPHIIPPPVPPNIPSNTQLDRKEKARIFMERLLNEKRVKKLREQEEARIKELEAQKAEIERQLAEEEAKRKKTSLAMVDKFINSRVNALLGKSEKRSDVKEKCKLPARLSEDEEEKDRDESRAKRKKEKSKKHKHRKSRSRSRSRDRERRKRKRSSDSRSRERDSKKRKKDRK